MFHTYPASQARLSFELVPGRRSWNWFELACNIPIYFVHIHVASADITRAFLFAEFGQVLDSLDKPPLTEEGGRLESIYLIAPGYISDSPHPAMIELAEIRARPDRFNDLLYVARDGRRLRFTMTSDPAPESEMQCILKIAPGTANTAG